MEAITHSEKMDPTVLIRGSDLPNSMAVAASSRGFQIVRLLSDIGGMADVYEAFQVSVRRRVAAKRLKPQLANQHEIVARFREEGEKLGQLSPYPYTQLEAIFSAEKRCLYSMG